ncbi:MAG: hypothetical protein H7A00_00140 [Hahellaceae bacterium]|nr:hypothetical protein [Hahellaceae bacterium]
MKSLTRQKRAEDEQLHHFRRFLVGGLLAMGGLFAIVASHIYLPPSLNQELFAAGAMIIISAGIVLAAGGYWGLLKERIKRFSRSND